MPNNKQRKRARGKKGATSAGKSGNNNPQKQNKSKKPVSNGRQLLRTGGEFLGGLVHPMLGNLGKQAGNGLATWLGMGGYKLSKNSLVSGNNSLVPVPSMHSNNQSVIVRHREFIGDVVSSSSANTFKVTQFPINAGMGGTFPWLATVAQQFQEYSFKGLMFEFLSTSGTAVSSVNTALGTVILATQYRANAPAYLNKVQMLNEYFSCDGKPCESFCHPIECDPKENPFQVQYVRGSAITDDIKFYDLGMLNVATMGLQGTSVNCGELWASYEVELKKPIPLGNEESPYTPYAHYAGVTAITTSNYCGTDVAKIVDTIGCSMTGTVFTIPANAAGGAYVFQYMCQGTASSISTPTFTTANLQLEPSFGGSATGYSMAGTNCSALTGGKCFYIVNPSIIATITLSSGTLPTSPTSADVYLFSLPWLGPSTY